MKFKPQLEFLNDRLVPSGSPTQPPPAQPPGGGQIPGPGELPSQQQRDDYNNLYNSVANLGQQLDAAHDRLIEANGAYNLAAIQLSTVKKVLSDYLSSTALGARNQNYISSLTYAINTLQNNLFIAQNNLYDRYQDYLRAYERYMNGWNELHSMYTSLVEIYGTDVSENILFPPPDEPPDLDDWDVQPGIA